MNSIHFLIESRVPLGPTFTPYGHRFCCHVITTPKSEAHEIFLFLRSYCAWQNVRYDPFLFLLSQSGTLRNFNQKSVAKKQFPRSYIFECKFSSSKRTHAVSLSHSALFLSTSLSFFVICFCFVLCFIPSMAAIGALRLPSSSPSSSSSSASHLSPKTSSKCLSFAHSHLSGEKISSIANFRRTTSTDRSPKIVSPKAVSDSKNSQTCLDPDASRVSFFFF